MAKNSNKLRTICKDCVNLANKGYKRPVYETYVSEKPDGVVKPRQDNLFDRPVYVPPKWNIVR